MSGWADGGRARSTTVHCFLRNLASFLLVAVVLTVALLDSSPFEAANALRTISFGLVVAVVIALIASQQSAVRQFPYPGLAEAHVHNMTLPGGGRDEPRSIQPGRAALVRNRRIEEIMMSDMGTFRTTIAIENPLNRGPRHVFVDALVDTGAELTWVPAAMLVSLGIARQKRVGFRTADGRAVYRDVGYAIVHAGGTETNDEVVFGEAGDTTLLGARSLEGLNLRVDAREKRLVEAGPMPAMAT